MAILRGFLDGGHIADAAHCHIEGSRNGGRGKGEHVHGGFKLLEALLVRHAEALFLVDYAKTKVFELHILLQNAVSADYYVDFAGFKAADDFLLLLRRAEARKQLDGDGKAVHALHKGLVVLPRKNGCGNEHGNLLAVHNRLERGADGDLRFAEAHVAAEQSVHGARHFHIVLDFINAAELVVGFLVGEALLKVALPVGVRAEGVALGVHTLGIEGDKLLRHILYGGADAASGALPFGGIELV